MNCVDILNNILLGNKNITLEKFKTIIIEFVEKKMRNLGVTSCNPECIIMNLDKNTLGITRSYKEIILNNIVIERIYNGDRLSLLTIFHELAHVAQCLKIYNCNDEEETIRIIKEICLNDFQNNENFKYGLNDSMSYYESNYIISFIETNAQISAIKTLIEYFKLNRIAFSCEEEIRLKNLLAIYEKITLNNRRYIGNCIAFNYYYLTIDEAFDFAIKSNPQWLDKYPQLKNEYAKNITKAI